MKNKINSILVHFCQIVYLTVSFFLQNSLATYASACTFGFIFSFIPIIMMILTIFIGVLHASPSMLEGFSNIVQQISSVWDINGYINGLSSGFVLNWVNLLLALFIIWMARKLFLSIVQSLKSIFNTEAPARPVINQLLTFAGELLVVIICAVAFLCTFFFHQILRLPVFEIIQQNFPVLFGRFSNAVVNSILHLILFIFTVTSYYFCSGTKPAFRLCVACSFLCILIFNATIFVITAIINRANYNAIYGVLGNTMIMLLEVYIFFALFMFFAQGIYTIQFFKSHLLAELYLLPRFDNINFGASLRRLVFITPSALMTPENTLSFKTDDVIYKINDTTDCVYYVAEGSITIMQENNIAIHEKGYFFGDIEFILNSPRRSTVIAKTDCRIIRISKDDFSELLDKNSNAALKAMSKLSYYTEKVYGRKDTILL